MTNPQSHHPAGTIKASIDLLGNEDFAPTIVGEDECQVIILLDWMIV